MSEGQHVVWMFGVAIMAIAAIGTFAVTLPGHGNDFPKVWFRVALVGAVLVGLSAIPVGIFNVIALVVVIPIGFVWLAIVISLIVDRKKAEAYWPRQGSRLEKLLGRFFP